MCFFLIVEISHRNVYLFAFYLLLIWKKKTCISVKITKIAAILVNKNPPNPKPKNQEQCNWPSLWRAKSSFPSWNINQVDTGMTKSFTSFSRAPKLLQSTEETSSELGHMSKPTFFVVSLFRFNRFVPFKFNT